MGEKVHGKNALQNKGKRSENLVPLREHRIALLQEDGIGGACRQLGALHRLPAA